MTASYPDSGRSPEIAVGVLGERGKADLPWQIIRRGQGKSCKASGGPSASMSISIGDMPNRMRKTSRSRL